MSVLNYFRALKMMAQEKEETYRIKAFDNTIKAIISLKEPVTSVDQLKDKPGVGKGSLDRVRTILTTGHLPEVDEHPEYLEQVETIALFETVYGIGPKKAKQYYDAGYRTLEDLSKSSTLTSGQKVGLSYQSELDASIPRDEVTAIFNQIKRVVKAYNRKFETDITMVVAGSYRRQKTKSGDIDIVIVSRDPKDKASNHIRTIVDYLIHYKIITDVLAMGKVKWLAICQLPESVKMATEGMEPPHLHRRIDFEIVDSVNHYASALLYFTGSKETNVRMREEARRRGWTLNQDGLVDETTGERFDILTEEGYFEVLGLPYLKPEERTY